ncbi:type VII secretion protein EccB [Catenuloplanes atrovinosus]|uniref:Type VII secretion protein EccB n=1 Tax=Catenuloplanes atrovinosus TaxID=137266 RepID=A0AAE3YKN9_9ACTN|nr:type VII secretion protein EccB [Catenuloplanes atrovinosus]MDR7275569.1 hypothetical protein [Catenuloplanes atrovinosus]
MWTQRDQLQAYRFLRRRIVSALQFGDANHPVAPGRRTVLATASGAGAALLAAVAVLVYSVLRPGSGVDWRQPGQIVIEKESGAGFVLGADGLLHPVLNNASARLLVGGGRTVTIPAAKLADAPRGLPLGIPGAPSSIPARDRLITGPWAVCTGPGQEPVTPSDAEGAAGGDATDNAAEGAAGDAAAAASGNDTSGGAGNDSSGGAGNDSSGGAGNDSSGGAGNDTSGGAGNDTSGGAGNDTSGGAGKDTSGGAGNSPDGDAGNGADGDGGVDVDGVARSVRAADAGTPVTVLVIGGQEPPPERLGDRALIVEGPDGARHVISAGRRLPLRSGAAVALGYDAVDPRPVTRSWLDAIPEGPPLELLAADDPGAPGPRVGDGRARSGQVLRTEDVGGEARYYLVTASALRPITETEAALLVGNPANRSAYPDGEPRALETPAADIAVSGLVERRAETPGYPARLPAPVPPDQLAVLVCATADGTTWTAADPPLPAGARALPVPENQASAADAVWLPPGSGLLVTAGDGEQTFLVGDRGVRHPIAGDDAAGALGYDGVAATILEESLMTLLPTGPELSVEAARQESRR